ncbi:TrkA C-terminal domain-containing protein [Nesterenkonia suensis]
MTLEPAPLDEQRADLVKVKLTGRCALEGLPLKHLDLPESADISLVIRAGSAFVPDGRTALELHDELLVVAPAEHRSTVEA